MAFFGSGDSRRMTQTPLPPEVGIGHKPARKEDIKERQTHMINIHTVKHTHNIDITEIGQLKKSRVFILAQPSVSNSVYPQSPGGNKGDHYPLG